MDEELARRLKELLESLDQLETAIRAVKARINKVLESQF